MESKRYHVAIEGVTTGKPPPHGNIQMNRSVLASKKPMTWLNNCN